MRWLLLTSLLLLGCQQIDDAMPWSEASIRQVEQEITAQLGPRHMREVDSQLAWFTQRVRAYCRELDCSVTSWGRTEKRNRKVGGVDGSHHLDWLAVDVVYDRRPKLVVRQQAAERLGLILLPYRGHDHLHPQDLTGGEV